ncbi:MAG: transglutaminase [Chitinophagaceae bacterium]|nr:transglutaminase [Chitinophagaceae bacterium]
MGNESGHSSFGDILVGFLGLLLAVPLFIMAHHQLPEIGLPFHLDRILLFVILIGLLLLVLRLFRTIITLGFLAALVWLAYGTYTGKYGFAEVYRDGRAFVFSLQHDLNAEKLSVTGKEAVPRQQELLSAMDYNNPAVRNFAISATNEFFKEAQQKNFDLRKQIQCFAVFKKINSNWNYVDDPQNTEYFAKASESTKLLAGDCDDHAVLMASCIKAIGGQARLVHTTAHIYPELFIGNKNALERINYIVREQLFVAESKGHELHYHEDKDGIWLNLDYTQHYPGGDFMAEPVLGILYP